MAARAGRVLCAACRHGRGVEAGARDGQQQRQRRGLQYQRQCTASEPAASGDTAEDFTYSYSAVQKEGVQADASPFDTYDTEDGADDRSADASGGYAIITLDVPAAAEFLHERGMAVYAENDEYVSYLVVAEAAHDLADAMELPEAERTALRQADDILIVEVAKTAPAAEEPAENTPAGEEESE